MRTRWMMSALFLSLLPAVAGAPPAPWPVPPHASVVVKLTDLAGLLEWWGDSEMADAWEGSAARFVWERSRIFLKLQRKQAAVGAMTAGRIGADLVRELAVHEAVIAVYDPGKREVLAAFEISGAGGVELAALEAALPLRSQEGAAYRGKWSEDGKTFVGLFRSGGRLVLSTSEGRLKEAASLSRKGGGMSFDPRAGGADEVLKAEVDLAKVRKWPQFKRYWIPAFGGAPLRKDRLVIRLNRKEKGLSETRLFLDAGASEPPPSATPQAWAPPVPFAFALAAPPPDMISGLLVGGVLKIPQDRRKDLSDKREYSGAAFGVASGEDSDFNKRVDAPPESGPAGLLGGTAPPLKHLADLLSTMKTKRVRWFWGFSSLGDVVSWHRDEGAVVVEFDGVAGVGPVDGLCESVTRLVAASYLCNPSEVAWEKEGDVRRTTSPVECHVSLVKPGVLAVASSARMLKEAVAGAGVDFAGEFASRLDLSAVGGRYVRFLAELGLKPMMSKEENRFMEDVIPSLLQVAGGVREIRKTRVAVPGGFLERVDYIP